MTHTLTPGATTLAQLECLWRNGDTVALNPSARPDVEASAALIAMAARGNAPVYGVNTGFGKLDIAAAWAKRWNPQRHG